MIVFCVESSYQTPAPVFTHQQRMVQKSLVYLWVLTVISDSVCVVMMMMMMMMMMWCCVQFCVCSVRSADPVARSTDHQRTDQRGETHQPQRD